MTNSGNTASEALREYTEADHIPPLESADLDGGSPSLGSASTGSSPVLGPDTLALNLRECFGLDAELSDRFLTKAKQILDEAAARMNAELLEENAQLRQDVFDLCCDRILTDVSQGLPLKQKAILSKLAEGIAVDESNPLVSFEAQLRELKALHCKPSYQFPQYDELFEEDGHTPDPNMEKYIKEMERLNPPR